MNGLGVFRCIQVRLVLCFQHTLDGGDRFLTGPAPAVQASEEQVRVLAWEGVI